MLVCDMDPKGVMAELTGREGVTKRKRGSMHMFSREKISLGTWHCRGPNPIEQEWLLPINTNKTKGYVSYMGDGAVNQGQVYESFNMAALWKLPVVYVVEDNQYGMGDFCSASLSWETLQKRGAPTVFQKIVNGMDLLSVREAGDWAINHARNNQGRHFFILKHTDIEDIQCQTPENIAQKKRVEDFRQNHDAL